MNKTELHSEFLGVHSSNPFVDAVSSPRLVMFQGHWAQRPGLVRYDSDVIKTGTEYEFGKYINDVRTENDCFVRGIVPRYNHLGVGNLDVQPEFYVLVEVEKEVNGVPRIMLDVIETPNIRSSHSKFGFELSKTDAFKNISDEPFLKKGTILASTASLDDDGSYMYGLNANIALMSLTDVSEDPFVISESFAKKIGIVCTEKRVINIAKDTIPLNLYGSLDEFKMFPNIGEDVRPDGLLFAHRRKNGYFNPVDLSDEALMKPSYNFDTPVFVKPGSKVIDIKVIKGNYRRPEFPEKVVSQLDFYSESLVSFYKVLRERVDTIVAGRKNMFTESTNYELAPRLTRLLVEGEFVIGSTEPKNKLKLVYKKLPVEEYRVEITTKVILNAAIGFKMTDTMGGKGCITKIMKDEDMPVDEFGVRADVIADPNSTIHRQNPGRTYKCYIGAYSRDNFTRIVNTLKAKHGDYPVSTLIQLLDDNDFVYISTYLHEVYSLISETGSTIVPSLSPSDVKKHVVETLQKGLITIYYTADDPSRFVEINQRIEKTAYKPNYTQVTMRDNLGVMVKTVNKVRIGMLYMMVLEKIADTYMAVSSAHLNNFGFPAKVSPSDKNKTSHALTPAKTLAETEFRLAIAYMPPEAVADLVDSVANPYTHKLIVKSLFGNDNPMKIPPIDREANPYGNGKALMILKHIYNASGADFKFQKEDFDHVE